MDAAEEVSEFAEPGDLIGVVYDIEPIRSIRVDEDLWAWRHGAGTDDEVRVGDLGIVVAMTHPSMKALDEDGDELGRAAPARYVLFPRQAGWMLADELTFIEKFAGSRTHGLARSETPDQ